MNTEVREPRKGTLKNLSEELNSCAIMVDELSSSIKNSLSKISLFGVTEPDIQKPIPYDALNNNLENLKNLDSNFTQDCERTLKTIHAGISRLEQCLEHLNNLI